jgi:hypothetical protein
MKKNIELNIEKNKEIIFNIYDQKKCEDFIRKNFNKKVLKAYRQLVPCSYKSDLWRFCILYLLGGIYIDIKYNCVEGFKFTDILNDEYFVEESKYWKGVNERIYTGLICVCPRNEIMNCCIERIISNVESNYYGKCSLDPTGPGVLGSCVPKNVKKQLNFEDPKIFYDKRLILNYYNGYRLEQKKFQKLPHYEILWQQNKIYSKVKFI